MADAGVPGIGLRVAYKTASPGTWYNIGILDDGSDLLADAVFPVSEPDQITADVHSATAKYHKFISGLWSAGSPGFTLETADDPATCEAQDVLRLLQAAQTKVWWRFERPIDRARTQYRGYEFEASLRSISAADPINDRQTRAYTLNFEGDDVYPDGSVGASDIPDTN